MQEANFAGQETHFTGDGRILQVGSCILQARGLREQQVHPKKGKYHDYLRTAGKRELAGPSACCGPHAVPNAQTSIPWDQLVYALFASSLFPFLSIFKIHVDICLGKVLATLFNLVFPHPTRRHRAT